MAKESKKGDRMTVLVIGAHGTLGRPVTRRLISEGYSVRALARDPDRAFRLLPFEVEILRGDVSNPEDIRSAAEGCGAVHINLATRNPRAKFKPELDGTLNVLKVLEERPGVIISKISGLGAEDTGGRWPDQDQKFQAEKAIASSGHPYLIWRPTWVMESLALFVRDGRFHLFVKDSPPLFWVSGDDMGRWVAKALGEPRLHNRVFNVQGPEAVGFRRAAERFIRAYDPSIRIKRQALLPLMMGGIFSGGLRQFSTLMRMTRKESRGFISEATWDLLGAPTLTIEDYVEYIHTTGDMPGLEPAVDADIVYPELRRKRRMGEERNRIREG